MGITVKYQGGPLAGRKANLRGTDSPPREIKATAQAKAKNMGAGHYHYSGYTASEKGTFFLYVWRT